MISPETAQDLVAHLSDEQVHASVPDAFLRARFLATGLRGEDQPEDLYLALLSTSRQTAVLEGCIDVFSALAPALFAPVPSLTEQESDALYHLMALIGVAHPAALQGHTQGILQLVLKGDVPKTVRNPIVRAALGYARTENDARFWEPLVSENLIPGYAFKALLQINPYAGRIKSHLIDLWKRKLRGELTIAVAPLTDDAGKARGGDEKFVADVIGEVWRTAPHLRKALEEELDRYPWSKKWITHTRIAVSERIKETSKRRKTFAKTNSGIARKWMAKHKPSRYGLTLGKATYQNMIVRKMENREHRQSVVNIARSFRADFIRIKSHIGTRRLEKRKFRSSGRVQVTVRSSGLTF